MPLTEKLGDAAALGGVHGVEREVVDDEQVNGDEADGSYASWDYVESGSITVTALDETHAVGTFTFTGTRESDGSTTREVTEGAFDAEL